MDSQKVGKSIYKVLVNATTITVGGGVQAAISFLEYATSRDLNQLKLAFAVSESVYLGLNPELKIDKRIHVFRNSPAGIFSGRKSRQELVALERNFNADIVYSIGFPSYVKFCAAEIGRYTNPWEICPIPLAWKQLSLSERLVRSLRNRYRVARAKRAKYFETQTLVAKKGIVDVIKIHPDNVFISPNSINKRFVGHDSLIRHQSGELDVFTIFCVSAAHKHKNIGIIPLVAFELNRLTKRKFRFIVTLPNSSASWISIQKAAAKLCVSDVIENYGPLSLDRCLDVYKCSDSLLLPTLAEVFSATYLEAMAMQVPILTSDLDFAKEVCFDAALYFDPLNATAAARCIQRVMDNPELGISLAKNGSRRLSSFPDPDTKHKELVDWIFMCANSEYLNGK